MTTFSGSVKKVIKSTLERVIQNDHWWALFEMTILKISRFMESERKKQNINSWEQLWSEAVRTKIPDLTVKHGPFKGMKYPGMDSVCGTIFPKLLGSYERELHSILTKLFEEKYTEIVNIGCAEGYYAIGLAVRIPAAKIFAYDIKEEAINLCRKMAKLNGVDNRVFTGYFCDEETLKTIPFTGKALILCDCEGYEKDLFTVETVHLFRKHDLIIEIHDSMDINISSHIRQLFEKTHVIEVIESIDDLKKAKTYDYPELKDYDLSKKYILLTELRPHIMEWFYLKAKE